MNYEYENRNGDPEHSGNEAVSSEYRHGGVPADGFTEGHGNAYTQGYSDYGPYRGPMYGRGQADMNSGNPQRAGGNGGDFYGAYQSGPVNNESYSHKKKKTGIGKRIAIIALILVLIGSAGAGGFFIAKSTTGVAGSAGSKAVENSVHDPANSSESKSDWSVTTNEAPQNSSNGMVYDVSSVAETCLPSVVSITRTSAAKVQDFYSMWGDGTTRQMQSSGSGVIIGQTETDLLIVTNHHVIEDAEKLSVSFCDDSVYEATVKGSDLGVDIALLYVKIADLTNETKANISAIRIGNSDALKIGQQVVAIGNALGKGQSVTTGILSAVERSVSTSTAPLLQTDAAINPGNSGGALLNMNGELVGINSVKYSSTDVEGMGYAIPMSTVTPIIERIQNKPARDVVPDDQRCYIGITGIDVDSYSQAIYNMPKGVYIATVSEDGPFANAGITAGSILTKFDDEDITTFSGLKELLSYYKAGETVKVKTKVLEGNEYVEKEYEVTLGNVKDMPADNNPQNNNSQNNTPG